MTSPVDATRSRLQRTPTWLLAQASIHAQRLLSARLAAADSRGYHYRLLAALREFGPASQAALGRHTSIDRSDVVAALDDLAQRGMVTRFPDPSDRRRNKVTITSPGIAQFERLDRIVADVQNELLAPLSRAERQQLIRLLTRILERQTKN